MSDYLKDLYKAGYKTEECSIFIGESSRTIGAVIQVHFHENFVEPDKVNDCLEVWSRDIAGEIARFLNNIRES